MKTVQSGARTKPAIKEVDRRVSCLAHFLSVTFYVHYLSVTRCSDCAFFVLLLNDLNSYDRFSQKRIDVSVKFFSGYLHRQFVIPELVPLMSTHRKVLKKPLGHKDDLFVPLL